MNPQKQVNIKTDWLNKINGKTVASAIEYLNTLDSDLGLFAYCDGEDLHGVELYSSLTKYEDYRKSELVQMTIGMLRKRLKQQNYSLKYYLDRNLHLRIVQTDLYEKIAYTELKLSIKENELSQLTTKG